ncbi:phage protein Gp36 family protein [Denitromonas sp.]|uniref:phage protein Gp36 family protein n=1 Tax=Denitromonas sp. TaxID=2734609 RepID=UPI003A88A1B4
MPYATHLDLAESPGARELAEIASPEHAPMVAYELMDAALRGADLSGWQADEVALAHQALARIDDAVRDAAALIDGYLAKRGYALPLDPVPGLVTAWARALVRYMLHKDRRSLEDNDPIVRNWRDAVRLLQQTADGKFGLHAADAVAVNKLDARLCGAPNVFGRDELRAFR